MASPNAQTAARTALYCPRTFTKRTKLRFAADRQRELIRHLGRDPSYCERILIARVVGIEWDLRRTDAKLDAGEEPSGHMLRARLAAENRLRLDLAALGMRPQPAPGQRLADIFPSAGAAA